MSFYVTIDLFHFFIVYKRDKVIPIIQSVLDRDNIYVNRLYKSIKYQRRMLYHATLLLEESKSNKDVHRLVERIFQECMN